MRTILILNPKGGCGKSTLATNIAGYFARQGRRVALADCDVQGSSSDWLRARPGHLPKIASAPLEDGRLQVHKNTEILVMDSPAGVHEQRLINITRPAQTVVIPVLPSPLDIRAAERFLGELIGLRNRINRRMKIATVANRVREDTLAAVKLEYYLGRLRLPDGRRIPFMTVLRASQNYIHAAEAGKTIFELAPARTCYDVVQWEPLLRWLDSRQSIP